MPGPERVGSNAAIAGASQAATMITAGLLAVIVAGTVGSNAETDGFFAAFAIYSTVAALAQTARTTLVARMLEGERRFSVLDDYLGAGLLLFVLIAIAFGPLGEPIAGLLTADLPEEAHDTASTALRVFIPAAALQIYAALGAAMLGALGDFAWAGVAFLAGGLLAIAGFVALRPALGVDGLAFALLLGALLSAAIVTAGLLRAGWRPSAATVSRPRVALRASRVLALSSVSFLLAQIGYLVILAVAGRLGVGVITVYTYSFMAMSLVQAIFVSSVPMVMAAPLAVTWDRRPASLIPHHEAVVRAGMLLLCPLIAAAALIGKDVADVVLREFTQSQSVLVVELFLILAANVIWGLVNTVPYAALVAVGRYVALALVTAAVVALQIVLALVAAWLDSVWILAAGVPFSTAFTVVAAMLIVSPGYTSLAGPRICMIVLRSLAVGAVAFGLPFLIADTLGLPGANWLAFGGGLLVYAVLVGRFRAEREIAARLLAVVPRLGLRAATNR